MDTSLLEARALTGYQENRVEGLPRIDISQICPITHPEKQQSSLVINTRELLRQQFGDYLYLQRAPADKLSSDAIESIALMRYQTFHLFKGWNTPYPDWNAIDIHPETFHHLLYDERGQIIASARSSKTTIYPSLNGHSPFEIGHMTAFTSLNSGDEPDLSVIGKFRDTVSIPQQGLTIGTIERLTLSPLAFPSLSPRELIGANLLVLSPLALDTFDRLLTTDITVIQADDAMTKLFTDAYGPEIVEMLKTTQRRQRALIDGVYPNGIDMVDDPCHTLIFNPRGLMSSVREYNQQMFRSFEYRAQQ